MIEMLRKGNLAILALVAGLCSYAIWGSFNDTKLPAPQSVAAEHLGTAIFAGGCFWCMEPPFEKLPGVVAVESGYTGGWKENPTYDEVSHTETGHVEAVRVTYDRRRLTYEDLLQVFWRNVDPTDDGGNLLPGLTLALRDLFAELFETSRKFPAARLMDEIVPRVLDL